MFRITVFDIWGGGLPCVCSVGCEVFAAVLGLAML